MNRLKWHDEGLNCYGFWIQTSGGDFSEFALNPIMLYNHHRTWKGQTDEILPIGKWQDWEEKSGELTGVPVFDMTDDFAAKIGRKVEGGFLTACSIGIRIIEQSDDPKLLKPGQTRSTVTKWVLKEVSVCDIPANPRAAGIVLYDENDNVIELSADGGNCPVRLINNQNSNEMKIVATNLGLSESASEAEVLSAIDKLKAKHKTELATEKTARENAEKELQQFKDAQKAAEKAEAIALVDTAIKDGRISAELKNDYLTMFTNDFALTKKILEGMSPRTSLSATVKKGGNGSMAKYADMSFNELDRKGLLAELKEKDPDLYQQKLAELRGGLNLESATNKNE